MEVCWVTTSDSPILLIDCRFVSQMTFESIEAFQINIVSHISLSPPYCTGGVSQFTKYIGLVNLVQKSIMVLKNGSKYKETFTIFFLLTLSRNKGQFGFFGIHIN